MNKALAMILAALAFAAFAVDTNRVTMTRLGSLNPRSGEVVTDVTFEGLADAANVYTKAETEAKIVELAPAPDYSTNNTALVETIEATAPAPGDYANVSNKAMNALSRAEAEAGFTEWVMPDGAESRYYIDYFNNSWVLRNISDDEPIASEYAPTDAVSVTFSEEWLIPNPLTITRTRLPTMADLDAKASTNDVTLTPSAFSEWAVSPNYDGDWFVKLNSMDFWECGANGTSIQAYAFPDLSGNYVTNENVTVLYGELPGSQDVYTFTREVTGYTLGSQSDKPLQPKGDYATKAEAASPGIVTNIVRDLSLGGIWDAELEVWWTPRMKNGSLTYEATTNVNLNAEN